MFTFFLYYLQFVVYYFIFISLLNLIRSKFFEGKTIMVILGSGGHTGEILMMLKKLDLDKFNKIFFVSSHNDTNSEKKAKETLNFDEKEQKHVQFLKIYRSRNVGQSYITSVFTTILSLIHSFYILITTRPNLVNYLMINLFIFPIQFFFNQNTFLKIVTNGPGVSVPICYIGFIYKKLQIIYDFKILFIESYCRTKSISLTGKLIEPIADKFIVMWKCLAQKNREFIGKIL